VTHFSSATRRTFQLPFTIKDAHAQRAKTTRAKSLENVVVLLGFYFVRNERYSANFLEF
jgi:hypothetical protein